MSPFEQNPISQVLVQIMEKTVACKTFSGAVFQYIDDWLSPLNDKQMATNKNVKFLQLCMRVGHILNLAKLEIITKQQIILLGID